MVKEAAYLPAVDSLSLAQTTTGLLEATVSLVIVQRQSPKSEIPMTLP